MRNPFTSRNMVKDLDAFFGRSELIDEIFQNLENFQNTSVVGERRSGKSSLLWRIAQPEIYKKYEAAGQIPFRFVFFDLQGVAALDQQTFFRLLADGLAHELPRTGQGEVQRYPSPAGYFSALVDAHYRCNRIVICLDEFETVAVNNQFDAAFLHQMRSFANAGKVAYITSSREPLDLITRNTEHIQGSDFWNIFVTPPSYLGMLTLNEADELLRILSAKAGMPFGLEEIALARDLAGSHPLFLQIAGFHIFETLRSKRESNEPLTLSALDRNQIVTEFLLGATPHFEHIWNRLSSHEQDVIAQCRSLGTPGRSSDVVRALLKKGLLLSVPPHLEAFSKPFQQFAVERCAPDRAGNAAGKSSVPAGHQTGAAAPAVSRSATSSGPKNVVGGKSGALDIWIGRRSEVLLKFNGPYHMSQFCTNLAKINSNTVKRFDMRVRALPQAENWRLEKQEIGSDVCEIFSDIPEISQIYTAGRSGVDDDELLTLRFHCYQEMVAFPFELINSLSSVDEGARHLVLTHPIRKSLLGIRSKKRSLQAGFLSDETVRILLVSSNVSGHVSLDGGAFVLPEIPGASREIETLAQLAEECRASGDVRCHIDVRHEIGRNEMADLLENGNYDVVHYSGHGIFLEKSESSCLFFRRAEGQQSPIEMLTATELNRLVERSPIKFFYLSCCQGAVVGSSEHLLSSEFLGIAPSLLIAGAPAVLSMRWPLNDEMAVLLATCFYVELIKGQSIDVALFRARKQVQAKMPNDYNWLSPVLIIQGE